MDYVDKIFTPQLKKLHSGKVRESFRVDENTRMIVVSDRISSFDYVLNNLIPHKGAVLNGIAAYWFGKTRHIIENHFIRMIDPNISLVKEAKPLRIEMIVRGYLTGSLGRDYEKGKRIVSGVTLPDNLEKNQQFSNPLLTPTTKEEHDREISPAQIVKEGWASSKIYHQMEEASLALFAEGTRTLAAQGIILVDTKYEFGLINGKLVLIDEIHTPDSSRFWDLKAYQENPANVDAIDKEYVRQWLLRHKDGDRMPDHLPSEVIEEVSRRYLQIYEKITGEKLIMVNGSVKERIYRNLVDENIIRDGSIIVIMGSQADREHCLKILSGLKNYGVYSGLRVVSAHKNGERIPEIASEYNQALEPVVVVAVAGRSNGLGGALAANLAVPVINCPPFQDKLDFLLNINSSLLMPSHTPALTLVDTGLAAMAALRCLNLPRLKEIFCTEIGLQKAKLASADDEINQGV
ncbi:MAG: AIR carboxylase family protein [Candidatus Cloacimonetes bacterium]|nr:AIR carboxylase family protein [Candidatus Cloacimonadota bacterium]